ncbi:hypothetical protein BC835DRAFT_1413932 [Cytidiella melzeri]|nr:hypothetical protein BC835DRAFT_1413932 [Cytidiella melzeri]
MNTESELLPMNESRTLFLHKDETGVEHHRAVQVTISVDDTQKRNVETAIIYALAQEEISEFVAKLVTLHLRHPLPESFVIEEQDYTLLASRKEWPFGRRCFRATWGTEQVVPFDDKWKFVFKMKTTTA